MKDVVSPKPMEMKHLGNQAVFSKNEIGEMANDCQVVI